MNAAAGQCYHCGLQNQAGVACSAQVAGEVRQFCCPACKAVASLIEAGGLSAFYKHQVPSLQPPVLPDQASAYAAYDDPEFQAGFVCLD
ncbi:MAG: heavy metal translocating P-type ATPase metal-binding domain-containing protein, partial [Pseudomonadales bacterium]